MNGLQTVTSGFFVFSDGKLLKSRSAESNVLTPWAKQQLAIRAS